MAWNEPGGSGDKDPWHRRKDQGPPDLDQILKNIRNKLAGLFGGGKLGGGGQRSIGGGMIAAVLLLLWMLSGLYIVAEGERGVVLRFGKKVDVTNPGLRWHLPFPIEERIVVNVSRPIQLELGYRRNEKSLGTSKVPKEALMLTEDENIVDIEFAIRYLVNNPTDYLFNISDPELTVSQAAESAVREMVGKSTLDFVITSGRKDVEQKTREILQSMLDRYQSGIQIMAVEMQRALPPEEVRAAFDDAVKAREDEQRLKNEAEGYFNDVIPRARGASARVIQEAQGYKASVIARAEGDARRFNQIVSEYAKAPGVTRERLYIEAMEQILSNTTKIYTDQKSGNNLLYLPLDKLVPSSPPPPAANVQPPLEALEAPSSEPQRERSRDARKRGTQ